MEGAGLSPTSLVRHWVQVEGVPAAAVLDDVIRDLPVRVVGSMAHYEGSALGCPAALVPLLEDRVTLAVAAASVDPEPAAMCSLIMARRHHNAVSRAVYSRIREIVAPPAASSLRCMRPDLQHFVAHVMGMVARACPDSRRWLANATAGTWQVECPSRTRSAIADVARLADVSGTIEVAKHASVACGGRYGVSWLPDDRILIFLLLLFGPPGFFESPPPCLPPTLRAACTPPWRTAMRFSQTTRSPGR